MIHRKQVSTAALALLTLACQPAFGASGAGGCAEQERHALESELRSSPGRGPKAYLSSISTNYDYLQREAQFDKERFPQRNLSKVTDDEKFVVDSDYAAQMSMKDRLYRLNPHRIFQLAADVAPPEELHKAGQEALDTIVHQLTKQYPEKFTLDGDFIVDHVRGKRIRIRNTAEHPLAIAGQLVQEDLILVKTKPDGEHYLAGGFLAFPTNWSLNSTIGKSMTAIHAHSGPDPASTEKLNRTINLFLSKLQPGDPARRNNWFIVDDPTHALPDYRASTFEGPKVTAKNVGDNLYLRTERQTLSRLPESGYILFTIKVHTYPAKVVAEVPGVAERLVRGCTFLRETDPKHYSDYAKLLVKYLEQNGKEAPPQGNF